MKNVISINKIIRYFVCLHRQSYHRYFFPLSYEKYGPVVLFRSIFTNLSRQTRAIYCYYENRCKIRSRYKPNIYVRMRSGGRSVNEDTQMFATRSLQTTEIAESCHMLTREFHSKPFHSLKKCFRDSYPPKKICILFML